MTIRKFHIYLADLNPRMGTEPGKRRPVVVVQTNLLNGIHPSTIVCPITTNVIKKASILRVHLSRSETGLKHDSDVLVDQIRAIDNRRFMRELGKLNARHAQQLVDNLRIVVGE